MKTVLPAEWDGKWRGQCSGCRASGIRAKADAIREETDKCNESARRGMDGGMWKRKRRVNWGRSDGQSGSALNDKDFPYKSEGRNREESIRLADEAVLAMMEVTT